MMNETNIKKMEELLTNEEFAQKIADAGSYENAYKLFAEIGLEASYDDFMAYIEDCRKVMIENGLISEDGELSVEMLDMISGGGFWSKVGGAVCCIGGVYVAARWGQVGAGATLLLAGIALWNA